MRRIECVRVDLQYIDSKGRIAWVRSPGPLHCWDYKETTYSRNHADRDAAIDAAVQEGKNALGTGTIGTIDNIARKVIGFTIVEHEFAE